MEIEKKEREARRQNVVLKSVDMREGVDWKKEVEWMWEKMEVEAGRTRMRKIGAPDKEGKRLVSIKLDGIEKKREVMAAKSKLKGERLWVEDNLTFEDRRTK